MIESETNVLVKNLEDTEHIQYFYFCDQKFHEAGRFQPRFLVLIGFLYCRHKSLVSTEKAMWGVINPKIHDTVSLEQVEAFLRDISYLAINLPKNFFKHQLKEEPSWF